MRRTCASPSLRAAARFSSSASIPTIDFGSFRKSDAAQAAVAAQVLAAFRDIGFAQVVNHSIPRAVVGDCFSASKEFFALPTHVKRRYVYDDPISNRGWLAVGVEALAPGASVDVKETMEIGNELEVCASSVTACLSIIASPLL
jgi:isopenicillin N synthase-like dioxygenase